MFDFFDKDIINKAEIKSLIKTYARNDNWHNLDEKRGDLGYGWFHYSQIRLIKPERILCVGSRWGFIPAVCALACKHNGKGMVDFVDAGYSAEDGYDGYWGGMGVWKKNKASKYFSKWNIFKHLTLHVMRTDEFFRKFNKRKWGYIHLDGDHSYKGAKFDFEKAWPKLAEGGLLAMHDVFAKDSDGNVYGVRDFWQEVRKTYANTMSYSGDFGLGVIQKQR